MPTFVGDALRNLSYEDLINWLNISSEGTANIDAYLAESAKYGISEIESVEDMAATYMNFYKNGDGTYTITSFNSDVQLNNVNPVDSNISTISRGNVQTPLNRGIDPITNKLNITRFPASGSFAQRAGYVLGSVGSAVAAVSAGITLGKTIDGALYNANPDFWDSLGLSSINPETWNSITNGDDSWQAGLFNLILGLDPDTGNSQLYMDENAFAYLAYALAQGGVFAQTYRAVDINEAEYSNLHDTAHTLPPYPYSKNAPVTAIFSNGAIVNIDLLNPTGDYYILFGSAENNTYTWELIIAKGNYSSITFVTNQRQGSTSTRTPQKITYNNEIYSFVVDATDNRYGAISFSIPKFTTSYAWGATTQANNIVYNFLYCLENGTNRSYGGQDGIDTQDGATNPDISSWSDIPSTLNSLQNQYPDLWNNPLVWDNYQPDGTNPQKVYIPVATPNSTTGTYTQPTSSNSTQANPQVNPDTSTQALIDFLTNVMTQPNPQTNPQTQEETDTQPQIPPQNPTDTGTGTTPIPVPVVGNASALWSVYHPTQAQVNQFGAWLWTDNIITKIQQLLQNPMEGIITLHKIFASPVDSGNGTIVVGRLDSEVPSATVNQQYVTVDCGSIDCYEQFGNVFDYSPHTNVSLYLPFIGIVPLNTDDIMRSTIHITYGVDIFTGTCLAMVEVSRDGNTANLYQYAGIASVEYPLTGSVHSGLITGLLGVAGSIAATVATGGVTAPTAIAAMGGAVSAAKSQNARAGGFSGNAGAMGIKIPYLIIERPQTKVADTFAELSGYPTNYSCKLGECSGHVTVSHTHIHGINTTESELNQIETLLKSGVIV